MTNPAGARRRWLQGWPRRVALGVLTLELLYVVAGNFFLHSAWGRAIVNRKPERLAASWQSAWTWLPGLVHLRGTELAGTSRRVAWRTRLDRGHAFVWLPSLARRHVHILWGRQAGAEVDVDLLPPPAEPVARQAKRGWQVTIGGLRLDGLRRVRTNAYELAGEGTARGKLRFQVRGPMELELGRFVFKGGTVASQGEVVARDLAVDSHFATQPYRAGEDEVLDLLAGASGELDLEAAVENLGFLDVYLARVPWLGVGGAGDLVLDLGVEDGILQPGSRLALSGPAVAARFLDFRAQGLGHVAGRVPESGGRTELSAGLDEFSVVRISDGAPLFLGTGLALDATLGTAALYERPTGLAASLRLPPARVPDLAALGVYVPEGVGLTVTGGSAELAAELDFDTAARRGEGWLKLAAHGLEGQLGDARIVGNVTLDARLPQADLVGGVIDVSGTSLELQAVRITREGRDKATAWWARVGVPSGTITGPLAGAPAGADAHLGQPIETAARAPVPALAPAPRATGAQPPATPRVVEADLDAELLDTGPIVVLMEQRLPKLAWFEQLLTVPGVRLTGRVRAEGATLGLRELEVVGGKKDQLEIRAEMDLHGKATAGAIYARYRFLDAALALNLGERDWKIVHPRQGYEEAAAAYRAGTVGEAFELDAAAAAPAGENPPSGPP